MENDKELMTTVPCPYIHGENTLDDKREVKCPFTLSQYCTLQNFESIIDSRALRFREYNHFVDKTEGKVIDKIFCDTIENLYSEKALDATFTDLLFEVHVDNKISIPYYERLTGEHCVDSGQCLQYVSCFSTLNDDLRLWNKYGMIEENTGCTLIFDSAKKANLFSLHQRGIMTRVFNVFYDESVQRDLLKTKLLNEQKRFHQDHELTEQIVQDLNSFLTENRLLFKDKKYEWEHEVRIVLFILERTKNRLSKENQYHVDDSEGTILIPLNYLEPPNCFNVCPYDQKIIDELQEKMKSKGFKSPFSPMANLNPQRYAEKKFA